MSENVPHRAAVTLEIESPRQPEVLQLIAALDRYQSELYPPESNHLLDIESLCAGNMRFFVARVDTVALGCGALRILPGRYGEVKRMFVSPEARGANLGALILSRLEKQARLEGLELLQLETGIYQPAALALYRRAGYHECEPFGAYPPDPLSVFMQKRLEPETPR